MKNKELIIKIAECEANKSLLFEKVVEEAFKEKNWNTLHSPYFTDVHTNKLREIDIVARMNFKKKFNKDHNLTSNITLITECKTISNYNIICEGEIESHQRDYNFQVWFGYDNYHRNTRLIEILKKTELTDIQRLQVIKFLEKLVFPKGSSVIGDYRPDTFDDIKRFSTFRETNIGSAKELDNSVLWKSFLSLNAACLGYEKYEWNNIEEDLLGYIDYIIAFKQDIKDSLKNLFFRGPFRHSSLHKILVTDAKIWSPSSKLLEIPYFRLIQRSMQGFTENWIDVVNTAYVETYIDKITSHYKDFFIKSGMKQEI